jgi:hypothetical protein
MYLCRCVNYGVLNHKKAEKLFKIVTERKKHQRTGGSGMPVDAPKKKKAKVVKEGGVDPDMQTSGADQVGSAII